MVLGDLILLLTGIYTLYKNDIRRKNNNEVICNKTWWNRTREK